MRLDGLIKIEIPLIFIGKEQFFDQIEIQEIMALKINFICRKFSLAEGFMLVCLFFNGRYKFTLLEHWLFYNHPPVI